MFIPKFSHSWGIVQAQDLKNKKFNYKSFSHLQQMTENKFWKFIIGHFKLI